MGDFENRNVPLNHSCVARCSVQYPPPFSRENFLSGVDDRRFKLIQARSGLRSQGKKTGNLEQFPNDFREV
jgi:hypothetical protein